MECCPLCGSHKTGRIGRERYYCAECCHEWTGTVDIKIYKILADGTTIGLYAGNDVPLGDIPEESRNRRVC